MRNRLSRLTARIALCLAGLLMATLTVQAVDVLDGPTLTMDPNGTTPLAGVVELTTDVPVQAQLTITFESDVRVVSFPDVTVQHYLPVLGLKPNRTYTVDVELVPGGPVGTVFATTGPLPDDFPTLVTLVSQPEQMEPGYTLTSCMRRARGDSRPAYNAIVDSAGEVVWYTPRCFAAPKQLPNSNLFYRRNAEAVELDLLGNEQVVVLDDPGVGLHHDLQRTPHGTYLSLTKSSVEIPDYPTSLTDPEAPTAPATLRDEPIVEFLPDGTLRRQWPLVEMLDTSRVGYDSLNSTPDGLDWVHTNAVVYIPDDDSIVVSVRHQDAVIKFSRATGELQWILGPHDNWPAEFQPLLLEPVGTPFRWQFHQHAPMWLGSGNFLLFDNGNWRASPFDGTAPVANPDNFSRGVEFEIDEQNMQVRQVWEFGENAAERLYSFFISDADKLPTTNNRLMTYGGVNFVDGVSTADLDLGVSHTRIIETTGDLTPVKVFELMAYDSGGQINVYRSERIPSLYPWQSIDGPNGVGDSLRINMVAMQPTLTWMDSPADPAHDPADYYMVYASESPAGGFSILDSTAFTELVAENGEQPLVCFKIVAANTVGTSGDEPAP